MTNPSKAKGSAWERDVARYLTDRTGWRVERLPAGATIDRGDLAGIPGLVIECKNTKTLNLAGAVDEAVTEAANVGPDEVPVAIIKRRQRGVADGYAVLPLWALAELLNQRPAHMAPRRVAS